MIKTDAWTFIAILTAVSTAWYLIGFVMGWWQRGRSDVSHEGVAANAQGTPEGSAA